MGSIEGSLKVTTVNPGYTATEVAYQLSDSQVKAVYCEASNVNNIKRACELANLNEIKIIALKSKGDQSIPAGAINFEELVNPANLNLSEASKFNDDTNLDETVIIPYSSGTTGLPKGVMTTHKSFVANTEVSSARMFSDTHVLPTTNEHQDVWPCFLPFYHMYGLCNLLHHKLSRGCKIVSMRNYNINHLLDVLTKHKATCLGLVPPVIVQLGNHPAVNPSHFESVRLVMCGASNLGSDDVKRLLKKYVKHLFHIICINIFHSK